MLAMMIAEDFSQVGYGTGKAFIPAELGLPDRLDKRLAGDDFSRMCRQHLQHGQDLGFDCCISIRPRNDPARRIDPECSDRERF